MRLAVLLLCGLLPAVEPLVVAEAEAARVRADFLALIDQAPEVRSALAGWRAAVFAAGGAAVLPDPRVWAEGTRRRMASGDTDGLELGIEQELPRWGERSAARSIASAEVLRARVELDRVRATLAGDVAVLIAQAQAARRRAELADQGAARLRTMIAISETVVAAGGMAGTGTGDVLALRTRLEALDLMAADERRRALDAEDDARSRCGLETAAARAALLLPEPATLDRGADTMLRLAQADTALAEAERRQAHSRRLPQFAVGAGWEREDLSSDEGMWKIMLSLTIPVQQGALATGEQAARSRAAAATVAAELAAQRSDLAVRRAQRAALQAESARTTAAVARHRGEAEIEALRQQIAAGSADALLRLLARLDALQDSERAAIDAIAEAELLAADLWRLHRFPDP